MTRHALGLGFNDAVVFITGGNAREPVPRNLLAPKPSATGREKTTADALALWSASVNPRGTIVEHYLGGLRLELGDDVAGQVLRWNTRIDAMVALFRNVVTGAPQAVSRTFLRPDGRKLGRKFLGPVGGAAIMLDGFQSVTQGLHVGEGVETCMSARALGLKPTWALGSKGAIAAFPVLGGIEALTILMEPDATDEANVCAERWSALGREAYLNRAVGAKDLNDILGGAG